MSVKIIRLCYQTAVYCRPEIHHKSCDELTSLVSSFFRGFSAFRRQKWKSSSKQLFRIS